MNNESQHTEWKESWRDEYLKWVCAFANTEGGQLFIGKDNKGNVTGIDNYNKLLEDLPNKIKNLLGLIVEVNLHEQNNQFYIEIVVDPYPFPVSYKGKYYQRSGSTTQEMNGPALDKFILSKQGKKWDGVPVPNITIADLNDGSLKFFKEKAVQSGRVDAEAINDPNEKLIDDLHLTEGDYLKRAAVLLFHSNCEKFFTGAFVKIGFFESDDDLRYQDEIHGNLIEQIEGTLDLLLTKYLKAEINYDGATRVERYPFPEYAIREALLNAIAHKNYNESSPIQISVYDNKLIFWNEGSLPDGWTFENLKKKHPSKPFNPDIANALFRAGYIESWGRGTVKILRECKAYNLPEPLFEYEHTGFMITLLKHSLASLKNDGLREELAKIVMYVQQHGEIGNSEVQELCNVAKRTASNYLAELEDNYLEKVGTTGKGTVYVLKGHQRGT